jgi:hypothetical protein
MSPRRRNHRPALIVLVLVLAAAALAACEKDRGRARTGDGASRPTEAAAKPPDDVVATVSVSSAAAALAGARDYLDAIRPGTGAMLADAGFSATVAGMAGARALDGIDLAAPFHLIALDGARSGVVLVGKVSAAGALADARGTAHVRRAGDWALLGDKGAVDSVAPWVEGALLRQPARTAPTATIYLSRLLARHADELAQARQHMLASGAALPGMAPMLEAYVAGLESLASDTERVVVTLEVDARRASLDLAFVPKAGTRLASFAAAQQASDYALLGRLPAASAGSVVVAGRFAMGPYREGMLALVGRSMGVSGSDDLLQTMDEIMRLTTGEVAMVMAFSPAGMAMQEIFPVTDGARVEQAVRRQLGAMAKARTMESFGMKITMTGIPDAGRHDDVPIAAYEQTIEMPAEWTAASPPGSAFASRMFENGVRSQIAVVDGVGAASLGPAGANGMDLVIDALRGKAPTWQPSAEQAELLTDSRRRQESLAMLMDIGALFAAFTGAPEPESGGSSLLFAMGFADGASHLRFAVPAGVPSTFLR